MRDGQRAACAGVFRRGRGFVDADGLRLNAHVGLSGAIQGHKAEAAAFVAHGVPGQLAEVLGRDGLADRDGRGRTVAPQLQGRACTVMTAGLNGLDADGSRLVVLVRAGKGAFREGGRLLVGHGANDRISRVDRRGGRFVHRDGLFRRPQNGLPVGIQGNKAEAAAVVVSGVPAELAEVCGADDVAFRYGRGGTRAVAVGVPLQGCARAGVTIGGDLVDADERRGLAGGAARKQLLAQRQRLVVCDRQRFTGGRVVRSRRRFADRDGLCGGTQNGLLVGIQGNKAEAATVVVGGIPAELAEVCRADDIAFRYGGGRAGAVAIGVTLQGRARARAGGTLGGDLLDTDEGWSLVGSVAGKQFLTQRQRLVVCHGQGFACGWVVRSSWGFTDRDGLRGGPQNGLLVRVQGNKSEAAAVIVGGVPAQLAEVGSADDIAFRYGGGRAGAIAVGIPLQSCARAGVTLGGDLLDADEGGGLVGRVARKQFLTQRQRLVVCHGQGFACGWVVRSSWGFTDRDGLRGGPQNGLLVRVQGNKSEAAAVIVGGVPAQLAEVGSADDIAFRYGGGRAGAIAVGIPLQSCARAGVTLGGDLLDADEGGGLVGRVARKQFLTQRQRLVVRHGQRFTGAGVVRHGGGFVDVDGLRLDALIGLTLAVQRHKAEAAAVVVGAVPDQTAEICGGNLLVLGNRGQRSVVGAQMQRGRSGTGALGLDAFNAHVRRGMFGILAGERAGAQLHRLVVTGRTGHGGVVIAGRNGTR